MLGRTISTNQCNHAMECAFVFHRFDKHLNPSQVVTSIIKSLKKSNNLQISDEIQKTTYPVFFKLLQYQENRSILAQWV